MNSKSRKRRRRGSRGPGKSWKPRRVAHIERFGVKLRLNGGGASPGISLCPGTPGRTALSAEIVVRLSGIESVPPRVHKTRRSVQEQVSRDAILHECVVDWQKLANFVEEQMTPVSVLGKTHSQAPLHFGGIQWDLLNDVSDLISGGSRLGLLIFMSMGLWAMASTVRRDRVRAAIPRKGAGLK